MNIYFFEFVICDARAFWQVLLNLRLPWFWDGNGRVLCMCIQVIPDTLFSRLEEREREISGVEIGHRPMFAIGHGPVESGHGVATWTPHKRDWCNGNCCCFLYLQEKLNSDNSCRAQSNTCSNRVESFELWTLYLLFELRCKICLIPFERHSLSTSFARPFSCS